VEQTLRSIFNQENFPIGRVQVLLIDDGSPQKIEPILTKLKNEKFQIEYHRKINANWGGVINFVKNNHLAKGDYITVLDSDDVLTPNCLFMIEKFINEFHPDMLIPDYYE
jgi:glycosyltransferase involved in cell wall biosynthesis